MVISDGHKGIQKAVERSFHGSSWQMCQVHFIRAVLKKVPRKDHKVIVSILKDSLSDSRRLQECIMELESRGYYRAADTVERFQLDLMNYRSFPSEHWRRLRTTNLLERVNKELKRRSRSIGAFPNDSSLLRIAGSILMDINEEWITSRRYLSDLGEISSLDTGAEITA
jgi:putative transposase